MQAARNVAWVCAALALTLGCGNDTKSGQPAAGNAAPGAAANAPGNPSAPAEEMPAEIVQGQLPKDYPSDLPIFSGATPTTSLMAGGSGLIVLSANAPAADVLSYYREQLPSKGWTMDEVTEDPAGINAHKDNRSARISISTSDDGSTEIGVAIEGS